MSATLDKIADGLYAPDTGELAAFLLADPAGAPDSFPLEETWSDAGPARRIGTHVFLDALPSGPAAGQLASDLRGALPAAPATTGFAWAATQPAFALVAAVAVALDATGQPVIAADAPVPPLPPLPPAPPTLTLAKGMAVVTTPPASASASAPAAAAALGAPPTPGASAAAPTPFTGWLLLPTPLQPPGATRAGIAVPLLGPASGDLSFHALLESTPDGDATVKRLAAVRYDPLRPLNPTRTRIVPLGPEYRLTATPGGGHELAPAGAAA